MTIAASYDTAPVRAPVHNLQCNLDMGGASLDEIADGLDRPEPVFTASVISAANSIGPAGGAVRPVSVPRSYVPAVQNEGVELQVTVNVEFEDGLRAGACKRNPWRPDLITDVLPAGVSVGNGLLLR